jgi:hypothetical protein
MLPKPTASGLRITMIGMVVVFLAISFFTACKNNELVYEWGDIVAHLIKTGEYKYMDNYSAFMPPLYPCYLAGVYYLITPFITGTTWLVIANFLQAVIFIGAVYFSFRTFFYGKLSVWLLIFFAAIIFFPPILLAVTKVSSFALALSFSLFFFALGYRLVVLKQRKLIGWFIITLCLGMYIRYEFGLYFLLLSCFLPFFTKNRLGNIAIAACLFFIIYTPWIVRNQTKIGLFTYSTSFQYNFSKGNNVQYDLFSSYNMPYDEEKDLRLEDEIFYGARISEKVKEDYLKRVNGYYLDHHFDHFMTHSVKKIGINFLQYFPDYSLFTKPIFAILYSLFFVGLFITIISLSIKNIFFSAVKQGTYLPVFSLVSFCFMLFFYSVAPIPRYALFFYPFFVIYILSVFIRRREGNSEPGSR